METKPTTRQLFEELYSQFTLEQLQSRLLLAREDIISAHEKLNIHLVRADVIEELINIEKNRLTEYYSNQGDAWQVQQAEQIGWFDNETRSRNDEERDLQEESYNEKLLSEQ